MWLVEKGAKDGPSSLNTRPWRLKGPKKFECMKKNLHDNKWTTFHDLQDVALGPSKRSGSNAKTGTMATNQTAIGFEKYYISMMGPNQNVCCTPSTCFTKRKDPSVVKLDSYISRWPFGPIFFMVTTRGLVCEAALRLLSISCHERTA